MPGRVLSFCCGLAALAGGVAAQAAPDARSPDALASAVETAIRAGDARAAAKAFDALVDARAVAKAFPAPDPELNGLYGRLHEAFGDIGVARAYLERSDAPTVLAGRRAAALLALAETQLLAGEARAADATTANVDAAALDPAERARLAVLRARVALLFDPARALAVLEGETGWAADWVRGQAQLLRGDLHAARAAADRAWAGAAGAPVRAGAVTRVALLRAGLAMAERRRDIQVAMLSVANAGGYRIDQRVLFPPNCGEAGVRPDDQVTFAAQRGANGRVHLFPVGASRLGAVAPFLDAVRVAGFTEDSADAPGGTLFTLRCQSFVTGGAPFRLEDPWAARLAEAGLFPSLAASPDDAALNATAERYEKWKARLGENNPALLAVATDVSRGLAARAVTGDVEPARVLEAQKRVRTLAAALGGLDGLVPSDEDIARLRAAATAPSPEARVQNLRAHVLDRIDRVPPDMAVLLAHALSSEVIEGPSPADRLAVADRVLKRLPPSKDDRRVRAVLGMKAGAERELGSYDEARRTLRQLGPPERHCDLADTLPRVETLGVGSDDYPEDLLGIGFVGASIFELDTDASGKAIRHRLVYSELGGLFDGAALAALPRFTFAPAQRAGRDVACDGYALRILWRVENTGDDIFPDLTVSPDMSSS